MKRNKLVAVLIVTAMLLSLLCGCSSKETTAGAEASVSSKEIRSMDDLAGQRIGTLVGAAHDGIVADSIDGVQLEYFNSTADIVLALESGKIAAYAMEEPSAQIIRIQYPSHKVLCPLTSNEYAFLFNPSQEKLCAQMNEFLAKLRADGTLEELKSLWLGKDADQQSVDFSGLTGTNGALKFATATAVGKPFSYVKDGQFCGYDVDIAVRFCREYGYGIEIEDYTFPGLLAAISTGKNDFGAACVTVTEERKQSGILFSDADYEGGVVLVVKRDGEAASPASSAAQTAPTVQAVSDIPGNDPAELAGKRVGVLTGSAFHAVIEQTIPDAQMEYYDTNADSIMALDAGKIDAYVTDEPVVRDALKEHPKQQIFAKLADDLNGFIFPKNEKGAALRDQFNEFLAGLSADDTLEKLYDSWSENGEALPLPEFPKNGENGTLRLATCLTRPPYTYVRDGHEAGFEIELAARFCRANGYGLEIMDSNFTGMLAAISGGKADFGASGISITEQRKETLYFSDPIHRSAILAVTLGNGAAAAPTGGGIQSLDELKGKRIAVLSGSIFDQIVPEYIEDPQFAYYNSVSDLAQALESGKADAYAIDDALARLLLQQYPSQRILTQLTNEQYAFIFGNSKMGEKALGQFSEFIRKLRADGTLEEIKSLWLGSDTEKQTVELSDLPDTNGTLKFVTYSGVGAPYSYYKNGKLCGYDLDLAVRFCREYGYGLDIQDTEFPGMLAALTSGKCDFGGAGVTVTEERKQSGLKFSEPNYEGGIVVVVKDEAPAAKTTAGGYSSLDELAGKKFGIVTGTICDQVVAEHIKDPQFEYINSISDVALALDAGKIDAYLFDEPVVRLLLREYPDQHILTTLEEDRYGFIFPKTEEGAALRDQFNEFLAGIKADGTLQQLDGIWFGTDESLQVVEDIPPIGENGTLHFGTESGTPPFVMVKDGKLTGYEIDIVTRFCKAYGYGIEMTDTPFASLLASVTTGKNDFGASCISITDERKETLYFSEPHYIGGMVLVVPDTVADGAAAADASDGGLLGGIRESFEKTFLREGRWKLFAGGIGVTVLITVFSTFFGTILGFLLFLVYRKEYRAFNGVLNFIMNVLEKTPVVVILMILYYIIFGSSDLKGMWVAVIGFSILFACGFVKTIHNGVGAIDIGQTEASLALGFTDTKSFLLVILPQAARHFLPNYKGSIVSLLKDTAVVGYIAVQDLTKVGDIVRSRTYEAFFPLIATAVIYFALALALSALVARIEINIDPKRRNPEKILRGIDRK